MTEQPPPTACWYYAASALHIRIMFAIDMDMAAVPPTYRLQVTIDDVPEPVLSDHWITNHFLILLLADLNPVGSTVKVRLTILTRDLRDKFGLAYNPWDWITAPPCP